MHSAIPNGDDDGSPPDDIALAIEDGQPQEGELLGNALRDTKL